MCMHGPSTTHVRSTNSMVTKPASPRSGERSYCRQTVVEAWVTDQWEQVEPKKCKQSDETLQKRLTNKLIFVNAPRGDILAAPKLHHPRTDPCHEPSALPIKKEAWVKPPRRSIWLQVWPCLAIEHCWSIWTPSAMRPPESACLLSNVTRWSSTNLYAPACFKVHSMT